MHPFRLFLLTLLGLASVETPNDAARQATPPAQRPPNVIVVFADDLGYAHIGSFSTRTDASRPQTPNLDRMAAEGIRLTNFSRRRRSARRHARRCCRLISNASGVAGPPHATHGSTRTDDDCRGLKDAVLATATLRPGTLDTNRRSAAAAGLTSTRAAVIHSIWRGPRSENSFPICPDRRRSCHRGGSEPSRSPDSTRSRRGLIGGSRPPFFLTCRNHAAVPRCVGRFKARRRLRFAMSRGADCWWAICWGWKRMGLRQHSRRLHSDNVPGCRTASRRSRDRSRKQGHVFEGGVLVVHRALAGRIPRVRDGVPAMTVDLLRQGRVLPRGCAVRARRRWPRHLSPADEPARRPPPRRALLYWGTDLHAAAAEVKRARASPYQPSSTRVATLSWPFVTNNCRCACSTWKRTRQIANLADQTLNVVRRCKSCGTCSRGARRLR